MGGKAFPNLQVPRISQELYDQVLAKAQMSLEILYRQTVIPKEAPGKLDYGDIDLLVEGPLDNVSGPMIEKVARALDAQYTFTHGNTTSYAVPHPEETSSYVQVDIETCPDRTLLDWWAFMKSYGDMMQIIGMAHRPLGITFNDKGMHLRIERIEVYDRQQSMILLTQDPNKVIVFLGLDPLIFSGGFENQNDLFEWIVSGHLFNPQHVAGHAGNSNDRQRMRKRPMFKHFVSEWLPKHLKLGIGAIDSSPKRESELSRGDILRKALAEFDKSSEYEEKIGIHNERERELNLQLAIRKTLPYESETKIKLAHKALRKFAGFSAHGCLYLLEEPLKPDDYLQWSQLAFGHQQLFDEHNQVIVDSDAFQMLKDWVLRNCDTLLQKEKDFIEANKAERESKKAKLAQGSEEMGIPREDVEPIT